MAEKRKKLPTFITPKGTAIYPWLHKADTRFNSDGEYHVKLRLPADAEIKVDDEMVDLQEYLEEAVVESFAKAKKEAGSPAKAKKVKKADLPIGSHEDDEGNETGDVLYNFKMRAVVKPKEGEPWTQKPRIFDAKGTALELKSLFGGSELKVAFQVIPFYTALVGAGISLRLKAVQVLHLVEGDGGTAKSYGFDEDEDGFEAPDTSDAPFESDDDVKQAASEEQDF